MLHKPVEEESCHQNLMKDSHGQGEVIEEEISTNEGHVEHEEEREIALHESASLSGWLRR
jgi:hypothetical protein